MELNSEATHTPEPLENPRLWRLYLQVDSHTLQALLLCITDETMMQAHTIRMDSTAEPEHALEEAIYSTPMLLADYDRVTICVRTPSYICVDSALPEHAQRAAAEVAHITEDDTVTLLDPIAGTEVTAVWTMPMKRYNFLRRTFPSASIHHHITPLLTYFTRKSTLGNHGKTYIHLHDGSPAQADIVCFDPTGAPAVIVTKDTPTEQDAVYYGLAAITVSGNSAETDEIFLCGDRNKRLTVMQQLRRFAASVMPLVFPANAFRAGTAAMDAPFNLILIPLCE